MVRRQRRGHTVLVAGRPQTTEHNHPERPAELHRRPAGHRSDARVASKQGTHD